MTWRRPKKVVFIRHGESLRNVVRGDHFALQSAADLDRLGGRYDHDIPLTELGLHQAEQSGSRIIGELGLPDYVYHSDYVRARQTTDGLLSHLTPETRAQIEVRHNLRIRERDPGYTWHMTEEEIDRFFPWYQEYYRRVGKLFARPVGGESIMDMHDGRLHTFINTIIRDRPGRVIWVVCHGHVKRAARIIMERLTHERAEAMIEEPVPNLAVTAYAYEPCGTGPTRTHLNRVFWPE